MIAALVSVLSLMALADGQPSFAVSLLQETKDIHCGGQGLQSLMLDKRDKFLRLEIDGQKKEYLAEDFYDDAVLLKHNGSQSRLLFQTQKNGEVHMILGEMVDFNESDCADTGSSKTCKVGGIDLFWSPSRLKWKFEAPIRRYGFFPNDATYHLASKNQQAMIVIDFGAKVKLLSGRIFPLKCRYSE